MATAAMAPEPRNPNGDRQLKRIAETIIIAVLVGLGTWVVATDRASAVAETQIQNIREDVKTKASKESVESFQQEIRERLKRIEDKLDREQRNRR